MADIPKIMEIYLANRRRHSDTLSSQDMECFVDYLRRTRDFALKFEQSQDYSGERRDKARAFMKAIDDFAGLLTGDRTYFHIPAPSYPSGKS